MKNELQLSLSKLKDATEKLEHGVNQANDELTIDGTIQRFEFTFELLWKTIKLFLKDKGVIVKSPKDSLKEAFRQGWLKDETAFLEMLEDRNLTTHIYNFEQSREIFNHIRDFYLNRIKDTIQSLEQLF